MGFFLAFGATLLAMVVLAWQGGKGSFAQYALASRQAGSWSVAGAIMGTLVGGASTVGTAELAFRYGLAGWWFTLGAGLACLFLGLGLARPLRQSQVSTVGQFLAHYYGGHSALAVSLFTGLGMFVHVVGQLLACAALLTSLLGTSKLAGAGLGGLLVLLLCLKQGMGRAGAVGLAKLLLLYVTMLVAGMLAYHKSGGLSGWQQHFAAYPWFSLFGYGVNAGLSDLLAMLVGVISTQTYLQALFTARSVRQARQGALISAVLIPPLGLLGVAVGLHMRQIQPQLDSALALPRFLQLYLPEPLGGVAFAALLLAAVGTAAGLSLGVATFIQLDIYPRLRPHKQPSLQGFRWLTLALLAAAFGLLVLNLGSAIMHWSFLSMGLRGATVAVPLLWAVFAWPARLPVAAGARAVWWGPLCVLLTGFIPGFSAPLYPGLAVAVGLFLWQRWRLRPEGDV